MQIAGNSIKKSLITHVVMQAGPKSTVTTYSVANIRTTLEGTMLYVMVSIGRHENECVMSGCYGPYPQEDWNRVNGIVRRHVKSFYAKGFNPLSVKIDSLDIVISRRKEEIANA